MEHLGSRAVRTRREVLALAAGALATAVARPAWAADDWQAEWARVQAAARKEGTVVVAIPPDPTLRQKLTQVMQDKFGIHFENIVSISEQAAHRIADEATAGVHYVDVGIFAVSTVEPELRPRGLIQPLMPNLILPSVKDPANWWGGHIFSDKENSCCYAMAAYILDNIWYNASLVKADEVKSWDDLLNPKWKGKIGLLDPRLQGAGQGIWGFVWENKGEDFLRKLAAQKLVIGDRRVLASQLAKGGLAITIGPTFYTFQQYVRAGLPVKPFPQMREGTYVSIGNGGPVIMKNAPHPNATKVFVNWLLSKDGQEMWSRIHGQATRRLDVDTKWMPSIGVHAAKDTISVADFHRRENETELRDAAVRVPAAKFAHKLFD